MHTKIMVLAFIALAASSAGALASEGTDAAAAGSHAEQSPSRDEQRRGSADATQGGSARDDEARVTSASRCREKVARDWQELQDRLQHLP